MSNFVEFAIIGLATGGIYALVALGIIAVHRSSGTVNFASGAMAIGGGYLFFGLEQHGLDAGLSLVIVTVAGVAFGVLVYAGVMMPLRRASHLTRAIATLGVLVIVQAVVQRIFSSTGRVVRSYMPQGQVRLLGTHVPESNVIILSTAAVVTALLTVGYQRTRFGLATLAAADDEEVLETLGWSASRIAVGNWGVAGGLAALAGALVAPVTGLSLGEMTTLLLPALAAALVGRLASFGWTFAGALGVGVIQSELTFYGNSYLPTGLDNLSDVVPLILIVVIVALRGFSLPARDFVEARLPGLGTGRPSPVLTAAALVGALLFIVTAGTVSWVPALTTSLLAGMLLLSLVVLVGYAGQLSLAQLSMAGVGGLTAVHLSSGVGLPFLPAAVLGVVAAGGVGLVVGLPAVRARGVTLAIVTLSLADALNQLVFSSQSIAGGASGIPAHLPALFGVAFNEASFPRRFSLVVLAVFVALALIARNLRRSVVGRQLVAVRNNERAAAALGISTVSSKLYAFVISSMMAGVAGVLLAFRSSVALFTTFDPFSSVNYVVEAVIGGVGYISGAVAGTGTEPGGVVSEVVNGLGLGSWLVLIGGVALVVTLIGNQDGLAASASRLRLSSAARIRSHRPNPTARPVGLHPTASGSPPPAAPSHCLRVSGITVKFGAVRAVSDITLELRSGEILGVIGPNGAGKTTLIDAITGFVRSTGRVELDGLDLSGRSVHRRSRAGISRSFQSLELFEDLTVGENLLVAADRAGPGEHLLSLCRPGKRTLGESVSATVRELGLEALLDRRPRELSYGQRRLLALARAVASGPSVLLLDEPAAGLDPQDREELAALIRNLAGSWHMAVLLIEHDVELVTKVSSRILAMNFGAEIASGDAQDVVADPAVIEAYLGEPEQDRSLTAAAPAQADGEAR